jgi:hypothetical protein
VVLLAVLVQALAKDDKVITPFGKWSKSCTYYVDADTQIVDETTRTVLMNLKTSGKKVIPPCQTKQSKPDYRGRSTEGTRLPEGWAAYGWVKSPADLTSYNGSWVVPADPSKDIDQTLFLFTGLQNSYSTAMTGGRVDVVNIIQPVLQFGPSAAGGGKYWALASWYVDSNDNAFWSKLSNTTSGNSILGTMLDTGDSKTGNWIINSVDSTAGTNTTLNIKTNTTEPFAFVTLEVYTVTNCDEYPHGSVSFADLAFTPTFEPKWAPATQKGCNESVTVNDDKSVTINF